MMEGNVGVMAGRTSARSGKSPRTKASRERQRSIRGAKRLPLNPRGYAVVDAADFDRLSTASWRLNRGGYAFSSKLGLLHRVILDAPPGVVVDHINRDPLDNRRANLRLATHADNMANRCRKAGALGPFRGVEQEGSRYKARFHGRGRKFYIGEYRSPIAAAIAFDAAARRFYGEFATLNFPDAPRTTRALADAIVALTIAQDPLSHLHALVFRNPVQARHLNEGHSELWSALSILRGLLSEVAASRRGRVAR